MSHHIYALPCGAVVVEQWRLGRLVVVRESKSGHYLKGQILAQAPVWRKLRPLRVESVRLLAYGGEGLWGIPCGTRWFTLEDRLLRLGSWGTLSHPQDLDLSYPHQHGRPLIIPLDQPDNTR